ncbi:peptide methionine sulfoxide reductase [Phlebotomus argentipes]|uniref:peptide methionine sulfoxide reductase n=1 Tax=Phlebotomus argentipes TaxID=94469 RepID=UPI0028936760|nr:peptide methionine sulfoxide reductase [Phlebotomus argentipes]
MIETNNLIIEEEAYYKPLHYIDTPFERATFGMGCFWGIDSLFGATQGVLRTRVGYTAGTTSNPVYKDMGDHTEVIEIHYDPKRISYAQLLELFWNNHEYGLCTRIKRQYASLIIYHTDEQKRIAEESLLSEKESRLPEVVTTEIHPCDIFYPAEDYHQKYRLQSHKELSKSLGMDSRLLQTSHIAARLNGYLVGVGGVAQFDKEVGNLGLTEDQQEYVRKFVEENEGGGLFC